MGFWTDDRYWVNGTPSMIKCGLDEACLGYPDVQNYTQTSICADGYKGRLCSECGRGGGNQSIVFWKSFTGKCLECLQGDAQTVYIIWVLAYICVWFLMLAIATSNAK